MTLAELKQKVYNITDLTSSSDETEKFNNFFDEAQKDIAKYLPIIKTASITVSDKTYTNSISDFMKLRCFYDSNYTRVDFRPIGKNIYLFDNDGIYTMEYCAMPANITSSTPDTYEFEIDKMAHDILPYYVAYSVMDIDADAAKYNLWKTEYQNKLQNLIQNKGQIVINVPSTFG